MALTDWELWACAKEMIRQHGSDATIFAGMRADKLHEAGEVDGAKAWIDIIHRIEQLLIRPEVLN